MENLAWKTPVKTLYRKPPTYEELRIIRCLCFVAQIEETDKFEPTARKCLLLGYPFGVKGYKLYDMHSKKVFYDEDIIFREDVFPFKETIDEVSIPFVNISPFRTSCMDPYVDYSLDLMCHLLFPIAVLSLLMILILLFHLLCCISMS